MSLVILDANLGEELSEVVLLKLMEKLKTAVDSHIEGRDREETIGAICSEIKNIVRQSKPTTATIHEVKF